MYYENSLSLSLSLSFCVSVYNVYSIDFIPQRNVHKYYSIQKIFAQSFYFQLQISNLKKA